MRHFKSPRSGLWSFCGVRGLRAEHSRPDPLRLRWVGHWPIYLVHHNCNNALLHYGLRAGAPTLGVLAPPLFLLACPKLLICTNVNRHNQQVGGEAGQKHLGHPPVYPPGCTPGP